MGKAIARHAPDRCTATRSWGAVRHNRDKKLKPFRACCASWLPRSWRRRHAALSSINAQLCDGPFATLSARAQSPSAKHCEMLSAQRRRLARPTHTHTHTQSKPLTALPMQARKLLAEKHYGLVPPPVPDGASQTACFTRVALCASSPASYPTMSCFFL